MLSDLFFFLQTCNKKKYIYLNLLNERIKAIESRNRRVSAWFWKESVLIQRLKRRLTNVSASLISMLSKWRNKCFMVN